MSFSDMRSLYSDERYLQIKDYITYRGNNKKDVVSENFKSLVREISGVDDGEIPITKWATAVILNYLLHDLIPSFLEESMGENVKFRFGAFGDSYVVNGVPNIPKKHNLIIQENLYSIIASPKRMASFIKEVLEQLRLALKAEMAVAPEKTFTLCLENFPSYGITDEGDSLIVKVGYVLVANQ